MPFLTIFTTPKPFTNPHIDTIQRNAIRSWMQLPDVEVLLIGAEAGLAQVANEYHLLHLPQVTCSQWGTPLISSIFELARQHSSSQVLAFTNADMIYFPDLLASMRQVSDQEKAFLVIGQRWDIDIDQPLDFQHGWQKRLQAQVRQRGKLHPPAGSDYFIFPRQSFTHIPDFSIGRAGWDNWMIYHGVQQGWPVIDATASIVAVHQNHDYSHLPGGRPHYDHEESRHNTTLAGGSTHLYTMLDTTAELRQGKIGSPRPTLVRWIRSMERRWMPPDDRRSGPRWWIVRRLRRWRRSLLRSMEA